MKTETEPVSTSGVSLALAVDSYNRYPGEVVTIYLRLTAPDLPGAGLQIAMPHVMQIEAYELSQHNSPAKAATLPLVSEVDQDIVVIIPLDPDFLIGQEYLITLCARLNTIYLDHYLTIQASIVDAGSKILHSESVRIAVFGKGNYLRYLPELYESDDFTSRFLMLFESFWKPVSRQIDQIDSYFDPMLTPAAFVPWLAGWLGLPQDDLLPTERMRLLTRDAMFLFQCRGTNAALKKYLEIYTSGEVTLTEKRARNFILGSEGTLGVEIALGRQNQPNSVSISLRVPKLELERTHYTPEMYQRKMLEIVRTQIPAHIFFEVNCEFVSTESVKESV
jgi:phage tail-like protein